MRIHFSSGGNFYHFYLGYSSVLNKTKNMSFSGISAGAISAGFLAFEIPINKIYYPWSIEIHHKLKTSNKIIDIFMDTSYKYLLGYTQKYPLEIYTSQIQFPYIRNYSFTEFKNTEDLVSKMICSCYIPLFGNKVAFEYENNWYVDGVLTYDYTRNDYDKIISYRNYISDFSLFDKIPNKDYEKNVFLYHLGQQCCINDSTNRIQDTTPDSIH